LYLETRKHYSRSCFNNKIYIVNQKSLIEQFKMKCKFCLTRAGLFFISDFVCKKPVCLEFIRLVYFPASTKSSEKNTSKNALKHLTLSIKYVIIAMEGKSSFSMENNPLGRLNADSI